MALIKSGEVQWKFSLQRHPHCSSEASHFICPRFLPCLIVALSSITAHTPDCTNTHTSPEVCAVQHFVRHSCRQQCEMCISERESVSVFCVCKQIHFLLNSTAYPPALLPYPSVAAHFLFAHHLCHGHVSMRLSKS